MTELETGWRTETPIGDTVLRQFLHNQAGVNTVIAESVGGRIEADGEAISTDAGSVIPFLNQTVLMRPLAGIDDPLLTRIEAFHDAGATASLLSAWPTPDLAARGWVLMGHPAFVVRAPGPIDHEPPAGVETVFVYDLDGLGTFERVLAEGYPAPQAQGLPPGSVYPPEVLERGLALRVGMLDGEPVAAGAGWVEHGVVNLCSAATLPAARRRGVWEALVWARVNDAPDQPAVAYTSDFSRPGFERMGFLPLLRLSLWLRSGAS